MNKQKFFRVSLSTALMLSASLALADGRLEGQVVANDRTTLLEGARVRIEALDRTASTGRDGRFSFGQLPAGTHEVTVRYLGTEVEITSVTVQDNATARLNVVLGGSMDEIVVRGIRAGQASALNQQKASDTIVRVVSADDIGALPDTNVAEAVQRVPGVFLERDQGEGRFIGIRGIDPNLNVTTINGLYVPSPESGARSVALDVIPSDLLAALEISKTFTPDMDMSAIGGTVNVRSLSAFDRQGRYLTVSAEGSYNGLVEDTSPKLAGSWSDTFSVGSGDDNFGIALAASWFDREFGSDNIETDGGWPADLETETGTIFQGAEEIEQRSYTVNRERFGFAANLDWRSDSSRFYWRNLYSEFSDQEFRMRNEFKFDDGTPVAGDSNSAQWDDAVIEKSMKDRLEEQTIISSVIGGENYVNEWTFDYSYGYSFSQEEEPQRLDTTFAGEDLDIGYTSVGQIPSLTAEAAAFDATTYQFDEFEYLDGDAEDEANTFRLNATYDIFSDRYNGDIKFGALYRTRDKTYDGETEIYGSVNDFFMSDFGTPSPRYGLADFGPGVSAADLRSYFNANRDGGNLEIDDEDTLVASALDDYELGEDVTALYLMSSVDAGNWRVVYGVRYEDTSFDAQGQAIVVDEINGTGDPEIVATSFSQDYDNFLPSINLRYESGDFVFRAAATQTLARPNFSELSPGGEITFEDDGGESVLEAEIGNPLLEPVEATNLDVSFEWYPGGVSVISAGVFYKRLENFIVVADVADSIDLTSLVGSAQVDDAEVIQPINGDTANLLGIELGFVQQYESGFYVSANGTYVDSEATYPDRDSKTVLPRTPELVLNGALGWESNALGVRFAATYRDEALMGFEELDDPAFDVFQDTHLQLDLSAKWNITDELQLSVAAINLTDEPFYTYFGSRQFNAQYEEYGRTYSIGLRYAPQP